MILHSKWDSIENEITDKYFCAFVLGCYTVAAFTISPPLNMLQLSYNCLVKFM